MEQNGCGELNRPTGQTGFWEEAWERQGQLGLLHSMLFLNKGMACIWESVLVTE